MGGSAAWPPLPIFGQFQVPVACDVQQAVALHAGGGLAGGGAALVYALGDAGAHGGHAFLLELQDGAEIRLGGVDESGHAVCRAGVSAVAVRTARPRMWPAMVKPRTAGVASAGTPMDSTSRACITTNEVAVRAVPGRRSGADEAGRAGIARQLEGALGQARASVVADAPGKLGDGGRLRSGRSCTASPRRVGPARRCGLSLCAIDSVNMLALQAFRRGVAKSKGDATPSRSSIRPLRRNPSRCLPSRGGITASVVQSSSGLVGENPEQHPRASATQRTTRHRRRHPGRDAAALSSDRCRGRAIAGGRRCGGSGGGGPVDVPGRDVALGAIGRPVHEDWACDVPSAGHDLDRPRCTRRVVLRSRTAAYADHQRRSRTVLRHRHSAGHRTDEHAPVPRMSGRCRHLSSGTGVNVRVVRPCRGSCDVTCLVWASIDRRRVAQEAGWCGG